MIQEQLKGDLKEAMKARNEPLVRTIRGLLAGFTNELVAQKRRPQEELSDEDAFSVIKRQVKQRKDSIEQFSAAGRDDLANVEKDELAILEKYLPKMMGKEEIRGVVEQKIRELEVTDSAGKGKLMSTLMKDLKGMADGTDVKAVVDELVP